MIALRNLRLMQPQKFLIISTKREKSVAGVNDTRRAFICLEIEINRSKQTPSWCLQLILRSHYADKNEQLVRLR